MNYDIIGDIHGHAEELESLLVKLGYRKNHGIYSHPEKRKVIFVGDFIDRGPKIRETLHLVKDMCDSGNAEAVMGNHEWNAICFHTPHLERGGFFRDHNLKEIEQHIETLRQFKSYENEWQAFLDWFQVLPLFLDKDEFRVVHACWDNEHIDWLKQNYKGISPEFLGLATNKTNPGGVYRIIDETLKGKEFDLPEGFAFKDKDGATRQKSRIKWWTKPTGNAIYPDVLMDCPRELRDAIVPDLKTMYFYSDSKMVFFGHYWLKGDLEIVNPAAICLDYSVAKGGKLVAYRFETNNEVGLNNFAY